jgi:hypothetical protein
MCVSVSVYVFVCECVTSPLRTPLYHLNPYKFIFVFVCVRASIWYFTHFFITPTNTIILPFSYTTRSHLILSFSTNFPAMYRIWYHSKWLGMESRHWIKPAPTHEILRISVSGFKYHVCCGVRWDRNCWDVVGCNFMLCNVLWDGMSCYAIWCSVILPNSILCDMMSRKVTHIIS